jgi:signal transduction histidine kinase
MNRRVHVLGWLALFGSLVAAVSFVVAGSMSFRAAAVEERERTLSSQIATSVNRLSAIEWQARTERTVSRNALQAVDHAHRSINASFRQLGQLTEDSSFFQAYHAYARNLDRELSLIRVGKLGAAKSFDQRFVDPEYETLTDAISKQTPALERDARRPVSQARRRLWYAFIATAVLVALLAWQFAIQQKGRRADRALLRRSEELARQKDEFVATVSHELRTPLTSIRGYAELLDGDASLGVEQNQWVQVIGRNADRLHSLVADLLLIAEVNAGKFTLDVRDVDLTAAVTEAVQAAAPAAEKKGLSLSSHGDVPILLRGDPARLSQVFDNLLSNAVKFTPSGGSVTVRTSRQGASAVLEIADSGIGIAGADQKHLFERFYRTDEATKAAIQGTGLGLAISRTIIDAHNGAITVKSIVGAGTTFRIELPAAVAVRELSLAS